MPGRTSEVACERRADNIVRDAEVVRKAMCQDGGGSGLWTLLGQSFGGFCAVSSCPSCSHPGKGKLGVHLSTRRLESYMHWCLCEHPSWRCEDPFIMSQKRDDRHLLTGSCREGLQGVASDCKDTQDMIGSRDTGRSRCGFSEEWLCAGALSERGPHKLGRGATDGRHTSGYRRALPRRRHLHQALQVRRLLVYSTYWG